MHNHPLFDLQSELHGGTKDKLKLSVEAIVNIQIKILMNTNEAMTYTYTYTQLFTYLPSYLPTYLPFTHSLIHAHISFTWGSSSKDDCTSMILLKLNCSYLFGVIRKLNWLWLLLWSLLNRSFAVSLGRNMILSTTIWTVATKIPVLRNKWNDKLSK